MGRLGVAAAAALFDTFLDAFDEGDQEMAWGRLLPAVAEATCSESAAWNEIGWSVPHARAVIWPDGPELEAAAESAIRSQSAGHPLIAHYASTGDLRVYQPADVEHLYRWRSSAAYSICRDVFGVTQQLGIPITLQHGLLRSLVVGRSGPAYTIAEVDHAQWIQRTLRRLDAHLRGDREAVPAPRTATAPGPSRAALTTRELAALREVATGRLRTTAARNLGVSPRTLDKHLEHAYRKLGAGSLVEAMQAAGPLLHDPVPILPQPFPRGGARVEG